MAWLAEDRLDGVTKGSDVARAEAPESTIRPFAGSEHDTSPRVFDKSSVCCLVGEQGADDERQSGRERAECGAGAAVADHETGSREDIVLRHPSLDVHLWGEWDEVGGIDAPADRHQHACRQVGDGIECGTKDRAGLWQMPKHASESHIDQGLSSPGHQSGSGGPGDDRSRNRRVSRQGDESSEAGNEVRYGAARMVRATPGLWRSSLSAT